MTAASGQRCKHLADWTASYQDSVVHGKAGKHALQTGHVGSLLACVLLELIVLQFPLDSSQWQRLWPLHREGVQLAVLPTHRSDIGNASSLAYLWIAYRVGYVAIQTPSFPRLSTHPRQRSAWSSRFVCVAAVFSQSHQRFIESLAYCIHCASCAVQGCGSMSEPCSDTDKASQHFLVGRQPLLISDQ